MADAKPKAARKYDAVLAPSSYPKNKTGAVRNAALRAEFAQDFGSTHVYSTHVGPNQILITPTPEQARYHGQNHALAGQDRYDWVDRGDGVLIGMLTEEALADPAEQEAATQTARKAALTEGQKRTQARVAELEAIPEPGRSEGEVKELAKLRRFSAAMFGDAPPPPVEPTGPAPLPVTEAQTPRQLAEPSAQANT
jgi:hypothetical protein